MEAAALYAFSQARDKPVICFAHVTNQMGSIEGDFEKGSDNGSDGCMQLIHIAAKTWMTRSL
jgi:uridine phosphorylase